MPPIQFGLQIPAASTDKSWRAAYVAGVNRALEMAAGHFTAAYLVDHLQFGTQDVLEAFTTLTYFAALHKRGYT